jgi:hypothetical protein
MYVDGDRERIPYEGDAYINQLGHYCVDDEPSLARYTHEYLLQYPTWFTEWQLHSVLIAWADYIYTGDAESLAAFYDDLKVKTLVDLAREDGLISTQSDLYTREFEEKLHLYHERYIGNHALKDLVDWPPGSFAEGGQGERDGHEMLPVNTVVNAFHYRTLVLMSRIAGVLGHTADQERFAAQATKVKTTFNHLFFDERQGVYVDGEGASHSSLHSNMTALAFDLVPEKRKGTVLAFVRSRGMACSVYGAQYLLEALYRNGNEQAALDLMTARHDRSWWHMIELGSTITLEAWDLTYKNNLDWNHPWGAVPANIIPRFLMGVRPMAPGFGKVRIQPRPAHLLEAKIRVPTPKGPVEVAFRNDPKEPFRLTVSIPDAMTASVDVPSFGRAEGAISLDGAATVGLTSGRFTSIIVGPGKHTLVRERT